jgi:WXG100 family type VII secretion target
MAERVRADYDQLSEVARSFERESTELRRALDAIRRQVEVLERGDWIGKGAQAFYREMRSQVLPSLQRLVNALEAASRVTLQASRVMKEAEDDSANLFRRIPGLVGSPGGPQGGDEVIDSMRAAGDIAMGELGSAASGGLGGGLGGSAAEIPVAGEPLADASPAGGGGGGGGGGLGGAGGDSGGGGSWSGEIGFKQDKPKPGDAKK